MYMGIFNEQATTSDTTLSGVAGPRGPQGHEVYQDNKVLEVYKVKEDCRVNEVYKVQKVKHSN